MTRRKRRLYPTLPKEFLESAEWARLRTVRQNDKLIEELKKPPELSWLFPHLPQAERAKIAAQMKRWRAVWGHPRLGTEIGRLQAAGVINEAELMAAEKYQYIHCWHHHYQDYPSTRWHAEGEIESHVRNGTLAQYEARARAAAAAYRTMVVKATGRQGDKVSNQLLEQVCVRDQPIAGGNHQQLKAALGRLAGHFGFTESSETSDLHVSAIREGYHVRRVRRRGNRWSLFVDTSWGREKVFEGPEKDVRGIVENLDVAISALCIKFREVEALMKGALGRNASQEKVRVAANLALNNAPTRYEGQCRPPKDPVERCIAVCAAWKAKIIESLWLKGRLKADECDDPNLLYEPGEEVDGEPQERSLADELSEDDSFVAWQRAADAIRAACASRIKGNRAKPFGPDGRAIAAARRRARLADRRR